MKSVLNVLISIGLLSLFSCVENNQEGKMITVKNSLDMDREFETIELSIKDLGLTDTDSLGQYSIQNPETKEALTTQTVDSDSDGNADVLLFQPKVKANSETSFQLVKGNPSAEAKKEEDTVAACYSRFVPERIDDYAWENNRVGFRTYGPEAQQIVEDSMPGGTLSSGIDAWLKRVDYPIINKWYKKAEEGTGTYHEDTGEGLDNFHVGASRGVGGVAVKVDTTYYYSKNFVTHKRITTGPLRTSFVLTYADWDANGKTITEEKHISLDYGSNLSRFEVHVTGTDTVSTGLTLHEQKGTEETKPEQGYISYWEPLDDSEIGMGIVVPDGSMAGVENYITTKTDESNLYAHLKVSDGKVLYYAGFGWKKSGQFKTKEDWNEYLRLFAKKINNPLTVEIN